MRTGVACGTTCVACGHGCGPCDQGRPNATLQMCVDQGDHEQILTAVTQSTAHYPVMGGWGGGREGWVMGPLFWACRGDGWRRVNKFLPPPSPLTHLELLSGFPLFARKPTRSLPLVVFFLILCVLFWLRVS